jgi:hypothetical protein
LLRLRLPERCKFCDALGTVRPEHTIRAKSVTVMWCCNRCDREWPITEDDYQQERRREVSDRRKQTRSDRRARRRPI